jgi:hypothetical protein
LMINIFIITISIIPDKQVYRIVQIKCAKKLTNAKKLNSSTCDYKMFYNMS